MIFVYQINFLKKKKIITVQLITIQVGLVYYNLMTI